MACLLKKPLLSSQLPGLIQKRFRGKINIQRPKAPHFLRARVIAVTQPIYPEKVQIRPCRQLTFKEFKKNAENPYETILAREAKNWFEHSKMIAVFHVNPINGEDFFKVRVAFHGEGMQLKKCGNGILKKALDGTKFEVLGALNDAKAFSTAYAFCTEHQKVSSIMKLIKKFPQMQLLCGVVENQLLSKNELIKYSKLPDISIVQSQLANVLNLAAMQIVQNLSSHQSQLVNILDAHVRVNDKPSVSTEDTTKEATEKKTEAVTEAVTEAPEKS